MVKIRTIRKNDEKQLLELVTNFLKKYQRSKIVSKKLLSMIKYKDYDEHLREDVKKYMKLNPKKAAVFVADNNGKLIGYIYGRILNKPKMVLSRIGIIEDWFVEDKYRGKGVGEMLWKKLISWFKEKRCNRLELDVFTTNKHAINIYHRLGFIDKLIVMTRKL
jgi:GNAT superfamily N-acetyltransferase